MTKKQYFKTISLIEAIYINEIGKKEKILIQRDWSQYFDFEIFLEGRNIVKKGLLEFTNEEAEKKNEISKINKEFIEEIGKILDSKKDISFIKNKKIQELFIIKEEKVNLNERIYCLGKENKDYFLESIKNFILNFNFKLQKQKIDNNFFDNKKIEIKRKFNFEDFLYKNEALFLDDNDFFNTGSNTKTVKNIIGKLKRKEKDGTKIDILTIENMIKKGNFSENGIKEENIFRININFEQKLLEDGKKENKIEFLDEKKDYNFVFWERNNFLVFDVKTNNG